MLDELVKRRTELKHVAPAERGAALLERLERPGFAAARPGGWVTTVYFDVPDRRFARAALERPEAHAKIRLREYFDDEGRPRSPHVWLELKARQGARSTKSRIRVSKARLARVLAGELEIGDQEDALRIVEALRRHPALAPMGAVRYRRASVEGGEPAARLTLDREIAYYVGPIDVRGPLDADALGAPTLVDPVAVLEVKHAGDAPPAWCRKLLAGLEPAAYSKFGRLARLSLGVPSYVD